MKFARIAVAAFALSATVFVASCSDSPVAPPAPQATAQLPQGELLDGLLRTLGFAATPGLLRVLGVMPAVAWPVFVVTSVWMLLAMIVAVRQALDYQTTRAAIAVCVLGWVLAIAIALVLGVTFGPTLS